MAYIWRSLTTFNRLDINPETMVKGGSEIVRPMPVPSSAKVTIVNWANDNGFVHRPNLVTCV